MELSFTGDVWYWRGPSPHYFITVPEPEAGSLEAVAGMVSYGWGMIPVTATIGGTSWTTSLYPKDGSYVVPIKGAIRKGEGIHEGQTVQIVLTIDI